MFSCPARGIPCGRFLRRALSRWNQSLDRFWRSCTRADLRSGSRCGRLIRRRLCLMKYLAAKARASIEALFHTSAETELSHFLRVTPVQKLQLVRDGVQPLHFALLFLLPYSLQGKVHTPCQSSSRPFNQSMLLSCKRLCRQEN